MLPRKISDAEACVESSCTRRLSMMYRSVIRHVNQCCQKAVFNMLYDKDPICGFETRKGHGWQRITRTGLRAFVLSKP
jgi:hypothetical protein